MLTLHSVRAVPREQTSLARRIASPTQSHEITVLPIPRIRPLTEIDINSLVDAAGGRRAHEDADRRAEYNVDYRLGSSIIELKLLDDEGLSKPERQEKIAALFTRAFPARPVVIVDPQRLSEADRREYAKIMQGPIQVAVRHARKQLKQSRSEDTDVDSSILFVVNNGFSAMGHEELKDHVVRRARNDTNQIDGVVVAGCYLHGDGFDTYALWPIDYVAIKPDHEFKEFEVLRKAWKGLADRHMTDFVQGKHGQNAQKTAQVDVVFDISGITFVKPATPIGKRSDFYGQKRPRLNELSFQDVEHVAISVPRMSLQEYRRIRAVLPDEPLLQTYETWQDHVLEAIGQDSPLKPVVPVDVTRGGLEAWKRRNPHADGIDCLRLHANEQFAKKASALFHQAQEMKEDRRPPRVYIAVVTEVIGQDEANDLSHVSLVYRDRENVSPIVRDARIPFARALFLGSAHALKLGISDIRWAKDLRYGWI